MPEVIVPDDELQGIYREGDDYSVPFAQIPIAVESLRELADKLERYYEEEDE